MTTDAPAQREAGCKRRDDGSLYIQLKSLPGFHFILPNNEDVEVALLPALEHFLGLYFSRILPPTIPANPEPDAAVVERVKHAIYLSLYTGVKDVPLSQQPKHIDGHCEKLARAALAAIPARPTAEASDRERIKAAHDRAIVRWNNDPFGGHQASWLEDYIDDEMAKLVATVRRETEAAGDQAGRDEAIRELRTKVAELEREQDPERVELLVQHIHYGKRAADYLATNRPPPASRES